MRILPGQTIAGLDIVQVRDALRRVKDRPFARDSLAQLLGLADDVGTRLHEALVDQGYVERDPMAASDDDWWRLTVKGNALTNASAAKPVKRSTADRALQGLLERAREVNDDDGLVYQVDEIVVFGSYLDPEAEVVADVDIAIGLSPRYQGDELEKRSKERINQAIQSGRRFSNFVEEVGWPQIEVLRHLKSGSRVLSLTTTADQILDVAEYRTVFLRDGATARRG